MLAGNEPLDVIEKEMNFEPFFIELKYDGERMLAHRDPQENFRFYSRNCNDFTSDFGEHPRTGKFCHYINQALAPDVKSVILDGEVCPYDKNLGTFVNKSKQMNIRQLKMDDPNFQQCLFVFDVVYYNGQVLTNKPLTERLEILKKIVPKEIPGNCRQFFPFFFLLVPLCFVRYYCTFLL